MKKQIALSITMLISLAGCKNQKRAKHLAHRSSDVCTVRDVPLVPDNDVAEDKGMRYPDDDEVASFFDEELGGFAPHNNIHYDDSENLGDSAKVGWIDAVQEETDLKKIYFEFNKYGVNKEQRKVVDADAAVLKELVADLDEDALVLIEGHACHSAGSSSYNLALSEKRAKYVRDLLVAQGREPEKIKIVGRGQEVPAVLHGKAVTGGRAQQWPNRRVEIRLVDAA